MKHRILAAFFGGLFCLTGVFGGMPVLAADSVGTVVTYPLQSCDTEATDQLLVTVNGKKVPVVRCMSNYDYCHFSFDGTAQITVTASEQINTHNVSPLALEISTEITGKTLSFSLEESRYLIVKINGLRDLVIAADDLEADIPAEAGENIFNIADYGAVSGTNLSTNAIQAAIDAASEYGTEGNPGIVYLPAGLYTVTSLVLKSHVSLYLAGGAVLKASENTGDYAGQLKFHKDSIGMDGFWMISTEPGAEHVKIYGRGTVDANGIALRNKRILCEVIVPMQCSDFTLDGIVIRDGAFWSVVPTRSDHISITNTKHLNDVADVTENDAIDIVECQQVKVNHTVAISEDDTYSTKTWDTYPTTDIAGSWAGNPEPLDNVEFSDCFAFTRCGAFKVGWGCFQSQSNITFRDSYVYRCMFAVNITLNYGTQPATNIRFDHIDVEGFWPKDSKQGRWLEFWISDGSSGYVRDVQVKNIRLRVADHIHARLTGRSADHAFEKVTFSNILYNSDTPATTLGKMDVLNTNNFLRELTVDTGETTAETADYTAVHLALNRIPEDLSPYTARSARALTKALDALKWELAPDRQTEVDAMAQIIVQAVEGLKFDGFVEYEAENGVLENAAVNPVDACSNGQQVGNLGGDANRNLNGAVTLTVESEAEGDREMEVYFCTSGTRNLRITVNRDEPQILSCSGYSYESPAPPLTVTIYLVAGTNTIRFDGVENQWAPNLDKIALKLSAEEQAKITEVETAIDRLPQLDQLTGQDAGTIADARAQYDDLPRPLQELVANYDLLEQAEEILQALLTPPQPDFLLGDLNNDNDLTVTDVVLLRKAILGGIPSEDTLRRGDMNTDKTLSVTDVVLLRKAILATE